jgi:hypothetical protein
MSKDKSDFCLDLKVIPQFSGTCWLNAILMSVLYSQGSKYYVKKASKNWDKNNSLLMFFKTIIFKMKKHSKLIEKMFKKIKPEIILFKLIEQTKDKMLLNFLKNLVKINYDDLGYYETYIYNLYKFLQVKVLSIYYLHNNEYYYNLNLIHGLELYIDSYCKLNETPDILVVIDYRINKILYNTRYIAYDSLKNYILNKKNIIGLQNHEDIITFNGVKYKLDSVTIGNYNADTINMGHAIAGITCNNNKYVYNGWSSISTDPAIVKKNNSNNTSPCSLMKYNWDLKKNEEFCLDPKLCKLDFDNIDKTDVCFSFKSDRTVLIYVRVDETKEKVTSSTTKEIKELSNIKKTIADIYDIDNLSRPELIKIYNYLYNRGILLESYYKFKSDNEFKEYLKEVLVDYYYTFHNPIEYLIKNIDKLDLNNLTTLYVKLRLLYKDLDRSYFGASKEKLLEYLKKVIKEKYKSDSKSSIIEVKKDKDKSKSPIVIPKKDKSKSPVVIETKGKYTKKQCDEWIANKLVNPKTNKKIQKDKSVYNDLKKHCIGKSKSKSPIVEVIKDKVKSKSKSKSKSPLVVETKGKYTKKQCDDWIANKLVNPITKRKIQQGKPVYNDLNKHCTVKSKSKSPIVEVKKDKVKSKSPLVVETKGKYTKKQCDDWIVNKLVNPITKRKIQQNKPVYNDLNKHCL